MGLVYNFIGPADLAAHRRAKYCPHRGTAESLIRRWGGGVESTGMRDPARLDSRVRSKRIQTCTIGCTNACKNTDARTRVPACSCVAHEEPNIRVAPYPLRGNLYLGGGEGTFIDL